MKFKRFPEVMVSILLFMAANTVWANDKLLSEVTIPTGQPVPIIQNNGVATGTIQLYYTATSCTVGQFAQFNLNLEDVAGSGQSPSYPVLVGLVDNGKGTDAQVSPNPSSVSVSGVGWIAGSDVDGDSGTPASSAVLVTVNITSCDWFKDGGTAIANLGETTASGSHLDTITNVNIHINAVASSACLNLYSFETTQDAGSPLTAVTVNAVTNTKSKNYGSVSGTSPGQASVDALLVNTCASSYTVDLAVGLDPEWQTNPNNNPGNATFVYTTTGELDPTTDFSGITTLITSSSGTAKGETLCLQNITVAPGASLLATVHSELNTGYSGGLTISLLPADGDFDFGATIFQPGSGCTTAYPTASIVNAFHENSSGYSDIDDPSGATTATSDVTFTVN